LQAILSTILVGVDGHEGGRDALALAQHIGDVAGGSLVAVHIYPYEPFPMRGMRPDVEALARDEAYELLGSQLATTGVAAQVRATAETSLPAACIA
jgi:nucleotide-binding universal stress UspA family protein